jgi:hypothetical protein
LTDDAGRTIAFLVCAAVAWTAVGFKVAALRRDPHDPALRALTACIALPAAGFTMATPPVYTAISRLTGVPNLATLLVYGAIVGYSICALILLLLWHLPRAEARRRSRRLLAFYGAVLVAMVVLFAVAHPPVDHPLDFDDVYGPRHDVGTFLLVYVVAFAIGLAAAVWRGTRFARTVTEVAPDRPWLARGLRLVAIGSVIAIGYPLGKAVYVLVAWSGPRLVTVGALATACACLGALVITTGFTIPSWGPRLSRARSYHRLYPLWRTMYDAMPAIALDPPRSRLADLLVVRDLDYRLYRRTVEIRDGRLALAPVDDPQAAEVTRLADHHRLSPAAVREALSIRAALGRPPAASTGSPPPAADDDVGWLVEVATALRRLPRERV